LVFNRRSYLLLALIAGSTWLNILRIVSPDKGEPTNSVIATRDDETPLVSGSILVFLHNAPIKTSNELRSFEVKGLLSC